jgi:RimJ/RimL family protein N-acetyltransferase
MRNPVLVGPRLYLRPLEPDDSKVAVEIEWLENETNLHQGGRIGMSEIAYRSWIDRLTSAMPPETIEFAVCLKSDDQCIGFVGLTGINWIHRYAETYSGLRPGEFRSRGYGTEAKHLLLEYAFEHIGMHVLTSWIWELNGRSAAAIRKQGYRPAGVLKNDAINKGVYYDDLVFDVLRDEWVAARDAWRASLPPDER